MSTHPDRDWWIASARGLFEQLVPHNSLLQGFEVREPAGYNGPVALVELVKDFPDLGNLSVPVLLAPEEGAQPASGKVKLLYERMENAVQSIRDLIRQRKEQLKRRKGGKS